MTFLQAVAAAGLAAHGKPGVKALDPEYRRLIRIADTRALTGSVDLDTAFRESEPESNRWDYGIGIKANDGKEKAIWLEPHSATRTGNVAEVIAKFRWLQDKLLGSGWKALKDLTENACQAGLPPYVWLRGSGNVHIKSRSRESRILAENGIVLRSIVDLRSN